MGNLPMDRLTRLLALTIALIMLASLPAHCQDSLSERERREILLRLGELQLERQKAVLLQSYISKDSDQDKREADLSARELGAEKQATALAQKETALWRDQSLTWEAAYRSVTKKGGVKFTLCKVFTLGLARCQ